MDNEIKKLLKDVLICIDNIENYVGTEKIFEVYDTTPLVQDAVERNMITIGEAINNLLKHSPEISIANARKIVDTRNRLTHGYDDIENLQIWNIIIKHLPVLKLEIMNLLNE